MVILQGAVPKGNATKENIIKLGLKEGEIVYKCPKCVCIKPDRAHHCRYMNIFTILNGIKNTLAILIRNSKDTATVVSEFLPTSDTKTCNSFLYVQNCEHTTS